MPRSGGSRAAPGPDALLPAAPAPGLKAGPVKARPGTFPTRPGLAGLGLAGPEPRARRVGAPETLGP